MGIRASVFCLSLAMFLVDTSHGAELELTGQPGPAPFFAGQEPNVLPPRQALVIGIEKFGSKGGFANLKNPANDAKAVTTALEAVGFKVRNVGEEYAAEKLSRQVLKNEVYVFAKRLKELKAVGLVYVAGHGIEHRGMTYLSPYEAVVTFRRDIEEEFIPVSLFYDAFDYAGAPFGLVIVDVCRDNPYAQEIKVEAFGRETTPLQNLDPPERVRLLSSVGSQKKALDGKGDLSPYAESLIGALSEPDLSLEATLRSLAIRLDEKRKTDPTIPHPAKDTKLDWRDIIFYPTLKSFNAERTVYNNAIGSKPRERLGDFLSRFPFGYFARAARDYLETADLKPGLPIPEFSPETDKPLGVIELRKESNLRSEPSTNSEVLETLPKGERLVLTEGKPIKNDGTWFPVEWDGKAGKVAYVRSDRFKTLPVEPTRTLDLEFKPGAELGEEILTDTSKNQIAEELKLERRPLIGSVELVGIRSVESFAQGGEPQPSLALLVRQSAAFKAIFDTGYDTSKVGITTKESRKTEDLKVKMVIRGVSNESNTVRELWASDFRNKLILPGDNSSHLIAGGIDPTVRLIWAPHIRY